MKHQLFLSLACVLFGISASGRNGPCFLKVANFCQKGRSDLVLVPHFCRSVFWCLLLGFDVCILVLMYVHVLVLYVFVGPQH